MRKFVAALLFSVSPFTVCASLKPSELAAVQVVDQFVQGCFMNFPYPKKFTGWLRNVRRIYALGDGARRIQC